MNAIVAVTTYKVAAWDRQRDALDWVKRVVSLFNEKHSVPSTAMVSVTGEFRVIVREARFESFAAWEDFLWGRLPSDSEWKALAKENSDERYFSDIQFQVYRALG